MKISWQISAASSAADTGIHKKILGSATTTQIISNDEVKDVMKIVKSHECSSLLLQGIRETIHHEGKEQLGGFLGTLLYTLGEMSLGNMLTGPKNRRSNSSLNS